MKKILVFFIFFQFFISLSQILFADIKINSKLSGCIHKLTKKDNLNFYNSKINKIEIDTHNYKDWTVNNIRIITNNSRFTPNHLKKRFDADIKVIYEDGNICYLKGRVRHSGDAKDHIALKGNSIIQSLDVTLSLGNIRGITRFKLFKPDVRGVLEDVVIQNHILRNFGYLAPRSIKVKARVNETQSIMLFQEKAAKELLEFNSRREGPILEADQKFFFELVKNIPDNNLSNWSVGTPILRTKSSKVMLSKLTNANLIYKGDIHEKISLDAINKLNSIFLYWSSRFQDEKNNFYFFDYDLDNSLLALFDKNKIIKLDIYNLFMQSTNSHHALGGSNRKFYWNSIENYFEPIAYDANPDISRNFSTTTTLSARYPFSIFYDEAIKKLNEELSNINTRKLKNDLSFLGIIMPEEAVKEKINKIKVNLDFINQNYNKVKNQDLALHNQYKYKENILEHFNKNLKEVDPKALLIKRNNSDLFKCEIYLKNCELFDISESDLIKLLEGELVIKNTNYQYVGQNLDLNALSQKGNYYSKKFLNSTIFYEKGIVLEADQIKNEIIINQKEVGARVYILNGNLIDTAIFFNGVENFANIEPQNYPIDIKGLTGCLSLINLEIENLKISATNSNCEDAVNVINSRGSIKKIFIGNSYSDGLDVDFSDLKIDEIEILNSVNDCADFSYGNYKLMNLKLNNCGDKGASLGETSTVEINNINVNDAKIGIATKDSSILNLKNAILINTDTCLAAYKKKQEFNGGFIEGKKVVCKNSFTKIKKDIFSKIIF